jgi:lipoprotein signal peptidase
MVWLVPFLVLLLDQMAKYWFTRPGQNWATINTGIAFSFGSAWLVGVGLVLFIWLGWQQRFQPRMLWITILAASVSNAIDRIRVGGVIDYIGTRSFQFNIADVAIVLAVALLLWGSTRSN